MKIIIPILGVFGKAGGWRVLSNLATQWKKKGHDVSFLVHYSASMPYFPTKANIIYYDNNGEIVQSSNANARLPRFGAIVLQKPLRKAIDKISADVLLANHSFTAEPVAKSKNTAKKFYYVQAYEPDYYYRKNIKDWIYRRISKTSYNLGLDIIVNAKMYLDYENIHTDKYVYPGLDLDLYVPKRKNLQNNKKIVFGTIARKESYKGTHDILEAFKILRAKYGDFVELKAAFGWDELNAIDGVSTASFDGDEALAEYYRTLDVYVCAGTVQLDAVHYPVIESMASGTAVVTTGYYPSNEENSWIAEIKNPQDLARKMELTILSRESTAKKVEKALQCVKGFAWENVATKMLEYFEK